MASFKVDTSVLETTAKKADAVADKINNAALDTYFAFLDGAMPGSFTAGQENAISKRVLLLTQRVAEASNAYAVHMRATKTNYEEAEKANIAPTMSSHQG